MMNLSELIKNPIEFKSRDFKNDIDIIKYKDIRSIYVSIKGLAIMLDKSENAEFNIDVDNDIDVDFNVTIYSSKDEFVSVTVTISRGQVAIVRLDVNNLIVE